MHALLSLAHQRMCPTLIAPQQVNSNGCSTAAVVVAAAATAQTNCFCRQRIPSPRHNTNQLTPHSHLQQLGGFIHTFMLIWKPVTRLPDGLTLDAQHPRRCSSAAACSRHPSSRWHGITHTTLSRLAPIFTQPPANSEPLHSTAQLPPASGKPTGRAKADQEVL